MAQQEQQTDTFAVIEIYGHKTLAGRVTKDTGLFPMLRIDVPETSTWPAYTVEYGPNAIFSIVYVSEQVARATAESLNVKPINVYTPDLVTREELEALKKRYEIRAGSQLVPGEHDEDTDDF
jgi:hypothetical protein